MSEPLRVLIVEDLEDDAILLALALRRGGYDLEFKRVDTPSAFSLELERRYWDIIISDYAMPQFCGLDALEILNESGIDIPFILVSGTIGEDVAVEAMKSGASDYFMKGNLKRLAVSVKRELREAEMRRERKKAVEALKESEVKYRALFENSRDPIYINREDGEFIDFNQSFLDLFGYTKQEVENINTCDIYMSPDDRTRLIDEIKIKGFASDFEVKMRKKNGASMDCLISATTRLDDERTVIGYQGIIRDITERKRAEAALRESEEKFSKAFRSNPNSIIISTQKDGKIIEVNPEFERVFGHKYNETIGKTAFELNLWVDPSDRDALVSLLQKQGYAKNKELGFRAKSGEIRICQYSVEIIKIRDEPYMISTVRDITEQKQAEYELSRLAIAIDQAAETVTITDTEGAIQYVNPAFEQTTGYAKQEAIGKNPKMLKSGKHDESFYKNLWDTVTSGEVWHGRIVNKKKNGELYEEESTISPIKDETGAITGYVAVKRDVTKEVFLEKELRETQKLNAIGTLAGGIAHDLNNILMPILGYSTMAKDIAAKDSETEECLNEIISAGHRAKELVKQILTFSRRGEQDFQSLEIYLIVKEALKLMKATIPATIKIVENIDTKSSYIMGDATQIHQVVVNLCTNAAYAMKKNGGVLTVTLQRKRFESSLQDFVKLSVSDTGGGMEPATLERIFEPFFTTKPQGEGTGLGLSVIHGIVESHGGHIDVESQPGEGTTLHVLLPLIEQLPGGKSVEQEKHKKTKVKGKALVVDDQVDVVKTIGKILNFLGYKTTIMTDSEEALKHFTKNPDVYDFVITDMTMPKMTGDKLAREMMKLREDIPVILMTGYSDIIDKEKAREIGVRALINKPITSYELSSVLDRELVDR
ncbi:diguanylate cyclase/phosphodiesterase (GGDEF & EAL domains) with PAS/PAC sensor(s) [hydrothermal vent metagenome]|uniref:Diguanylate cyclase/phosphodiesterase (GGDEF & EAL domains) with PAS/PAC sensor(S) n=1 Tax=hydrothermal vent metagenome TaxID=652676 RepID=A0A3B1C5V9_9ZZZZ